MRSRSKVVIVVAVMVLFGALAPAAAERTGPPRGTMKHQLVLKGWWVQPGCVPTAPPTVDVEGQRMDVTCVGAAAYAGDLTGYAIQHIDGSSSPEATTATIVADIYGRTDGNLCGTLRLEPETALVVGPIATGVGPIISGTGDFEGVTGWYDTKGHAAAGFGAGDYTITLKFPGRIPTPSPMPCVPPAPDGAPR